MPSEYQVRCVICSYGFNGCEIVYRNGKCPNCWDEKDAVRNWSSWFFEQYQDFDKDSSSIKDTVKIMVTAYRENFRRDMKREIYNGLSRSRPAFCRDKEKWLAWARLLCKIIMAAKGRRTEPRVKLELPDQVRIPLFKVVEQEKPIRKRTPRTP